MTANADLKAVVRNWIAKRILSTNDDYLASNDYVKFHQIEEESATSGVYSTILKDTDESGQIEFIDTLDASEKNGRIILLDENDQVVPIYNENKGTQLSMRTAQNIMPIYAFCYENGKYVGVGYECCCYSTDGETFTAGTIPEGTYNGIAYGNGKFVAVGTDICAYSTDGITFTAGTIPEGNYRNIIYGNGKFVAFSNDIIVYSSDGETFTTTTYPEHSGYYHGIAYGDIESGLDTESAYKGSRNDRMISLVDDGIRTQCSSRKFQSRRVFIESFQHLNVTIGNDVIEGHLSHKCIRRSVKTFIAVFSFLQ